MWILPTQTASYAVAYEASEGLRAHGQARKASIGFIVVTLLGLAVVFPYWEWLNLVGLKP